MVCVVHFDSVDAVEYLVQSELCHAVTNKNLCRQNDLLDDPTSSKDLLRYEIANAVPFDSTQPIPDHIVRYNGPWPILLCNLRDDFHDNHRIAAASTLVDVDQDLSCLTIDSIHKSYLVILFKIILLTDANGICPEDRWSWSWRVFLIGVCYTVDVKPVLWI